MALEEEEDGGDRRDSQAVKAKFERWMRLKQDGINFNERLVSNRAFHNPNIAVKMLEFMGINEHGTLFPPTIYNPSDFPLDADHETMAHAQRSKWEEENRPIMGPSGRVAPPYVQAPSGLQRAFVPSKKHQIMMERFYSRDRQ